jgi:hypothetical protein
MHHVFYLAAALNRPMHHTMKAKRLFRRVAVLVGNVLISFSLSACPEVKNGNQKHLRNITEQVSLSLVWFRGAILPIVPSLKYAERFNSDCKLRCRRSDRPSFDAEHSAQDALDTWHTSVATLNANEFQLLTLRVAGSLTAKQPRT